MKWQSTITAFLVCLGTLSWAGQGSSANESSSNTAETAKGNRGS